MIQTETTLFTKSGPANTGRTLDLARARAETLGIRTMLVATSSGETGRRAAELFQGFKLVVVTHSTGFAGPNIQDLTEENREAIEAAGTTLLTCQHALGGVNRAVRKKLGTFQLDEIIAYTLRTMGQGFKVALEITLMAADAGLVRTDEPVMSIGGTGTGADTAVVLLPTNAQTFFDLKVLEIVCRPSPEHPAFA